MTLVQIDTRRQVGLGQFPAYQMVRRANGKHSFLVYGPRIHVGVLATTYCVGYSKEYVFSCFDRSGTQRVKLVRNGWHSRRVTDADRQVFFDGVDKGNPGPRGANYRRAASTGAATSLG